VMPIVLVPVLIAVVVASIVTTGGVASDID
jgi:hypothetical protein